MDSLKRWKIFQNLDSVFAANVKSACIIGMDAAGSQQIPECRGALMVMRSGDVYSIVLTSNDLALLGVAEVKGLSRLVPVKIDALSGLGIRAVSSGVNHVAVVTTDGRVYEWGRMYFVDKWELLKPRFVSGNLDGQNIVHVASGRMHTLVLTMGGQTGNGSVGFGFAGIHADPVKIDGFDKKIVSLACGGWTSYALDCEGNVWSWGYNSLGALGFQTEVDQRFPRKIPISNIKQMAAGKHHVLALSTEEKIYFWGRHTEREANIVTPKQIDVPNVVDIGVVRGCSVSAIKTAAGKVYYWGFTAGHLIPEPVATEFSSLDEFFASLDNPVMLRPLQFDLKLPKVVTQKLRQSFDDEETGDIKFVLEGRSIHAHKEYLKLRSDHFKRMFNNNWRGSNGDESVIKISNFAYPAFRTFLLYLYADRIEPVPRSEEDFVEMFKLADYYGEESLKTHCEEQLKEFLASLYNPLMFRPVQFEAKLPEVVIEKLRQSFDDQETGDVTFIFDGRSIHSHKQFLKLRSDHFKRMFDNNWKENNGNEAVIEVTNFTYPAFRTFLLYLYTDRIEPTPRTAEDFIEMFELADYYGEEILSRHCEEQLKALINIENFSALYAIAVQFNAKILHAMALDFAIPNFNDVVKSEGYKKMQDALKNRLIEELADEDTFVGLKKKPRFK